MKQLEIISHLPALLEKAKGIDVALLIGSFARKEPTWRSDIDVSLLINATFNVQDFAKIMQKGLEEIAQILKVHIVNTPFMFYG